MGWGLKGSLWGRSLWGPYGVAMVSLRCPNGVPVGSQWGPYGVGPYGVPLGSFWGPCGVLMGSPCCALRLLQQQCGVGCGAGGRGAVPTAPRWVPFPTPKHLPVLGSQRGHCGGHPPHRAPHTSPSGPRRPYKAPFPRRVPIQSHIVLYGPVWPYRAP